MSFWDRVKSMWTANQDQVVSGWLTGPGPELNGQSAEGRYYFELHCIDMSIQFAVQNGAGRRPLLQSLVRWPHGAEMISVSSTLGSESFKDLSQSTFVEMIFDDVALTGELPLNGGSIDVSVALLSVPGSSIFDRATTFLTNLAALTKIPQLTAAAPVAEKVASGIDSLLGNTDTDGLIAFRTTVSAAAPREGYYVITDWPAGAGKKESLRVLDGKLEVMGAGGSHQSPRGMFSYVVLEFRLWGAKPKRWNSLPEVRGMFTGALEALAKAASPEDVKGAAVLLQLAGVKARQSEDLTVDDGRAALENMADEWQANRATNKVLSAGAGNLADTTVYDEMQAAADVAWSDLLSQLDLPALPDPLEPPELES